MPNYDLGLLISLDIGLAMIGIVATGLFAWTIIRHVSREQSDTREIVREVAQMQREVAFMIRRQYGDIDRDLQEIKELLGGQ